jgi:hypothetical protein
MLCYDSVLQIKFSVVLLFFLGLSAILFLILFSDFGTIVQHGRQKIFFFFWLFNVGVQFEGHHQLL